MGFFDLAGSLKKTFGEEDKIKKTLAKAGDDAIKDPMERQKLAKQLGDIQKEGMGGFMGRLGGNMMDSAKSNLGFGKDGQWSMQNMMNARQGEDAKAAIPPVVASQIPIPKTPAAQAMAPGMSPFMQNAMQPAIPGMPNVGASPALQQIMAAQQQYQQFGAPQQYTNPGLMSMLQGPETHGKTGAINVPPDYESALKKLMMAGMG